MVHDHLLRMQISKSADRNSVTDANKLVCPSAVD